MVRSLKAVLPLAALVSMGCASLDGLRAFIQPPRFRQDDQRRSELRLVGTSGAAVRIWTKVSNPNGFGLNLGTLRGTLYLEGGRAATADFPLGLPLPARGEEVVPLDVSVSFRDLPGLGEAVARALARQPVRYGLEGTIGVSAGGFGEQVLGPMQFLSGELR
jgi:hypothetical protein